MESLAGMGRGKASFSSPCCICDKTNIWEGRKVQESRNWGLISSLLALVHRCEKQEIRMVSSRIAEALPHIIHHLYILISPILTYSCLKILPFNLPCIKLRYSHTKANLLIQCNLTEGDPKVTPSCTALHPQAAGIRHR